MYLIFVLHSSAGFGKCGLRLISVGISELRRSQPKLIVLLLIWSHRCPAVIFYQVQVLLNIRNKTFSGRFMVTGRTARFLSPLSFCFSSDIDGRCIIKYVMISSRSILIWLTPYVGLVQSIRAPSWREADPVSCSIHNVNRSCPIGHEATSYVSDSAISGS